MKHKNEEHILLEMFDLDVSFLYYIKKLKLWSCNTFLDAFLAYYFYILLCIKMWIGQLGSCVFILHL